MRSFCPVRQMASCAPDVDCDEILRAIHVFRRSLLLEWCYKKGKYDIIERNRAPIDIFCRGIAGDGKKAGDGQ